MNFYYAMAYFLSEKQMDSCRLSKIVELKDGGGDE